MSASNVSTARLWLVETSLELTEADAILNTAHRVPFSYSAGWFHIPGRGRAEDKSKCHLHVVLRRIRVLTLMRSINSLNIHINNQPGVTDHQSKLLSVSAPKSRFLARTIETAITVADSPRRHPGPVAQRSTPTGKGGPSIQNAQATRSFWSRQPNKNGCMLARKPEAKTEISLTKK